MIINNYFTSQDIANLATKYNIENQFYVLAGVFGIIATILIIMLAFFDAEKKKGLRIATIIITVLCIINAVIYNVIDTTEIDKAYIVNELSNSEVIGYDSNKNAIKVSKNGDVADIDLNKFNVKLTNDYDEITFDCNSGTAYIPSKYIAEEIEIRGKYSSKDIEEYQNLKNKCNKVLFLILILGAIGIIAILISPLIVGKNTDENNKKTDKVINKVFLEGLICITAGMIVLTVICVVLMAKTSESGKPLQIEVNDGKIIGYNVTIEDSEENEYNSTLTVLDSDNTIRTVKVLSTGKINTVENNNLDRKYFNYTTLTMYIPYNAQ